MVKGPTAHALRCETLHWVWQNTHTLRHGAKARRLGQHGADGISPTESHDALMGLFEQCDFGLDRDDDGEFTQADDEICDVWNALAGSWGLKGHLDLVDRLLEIGKAADPEYGTSALDGCPLLQQLAKVAVAEAAQADLDGVLDVLEVEEQREAAAAW